VVSRAVQQAAREAGYLVWLAVSDNDPSTEEAEMEQMTNHPVDGILLAPVNSRSKHLKAAATASIPIVTIDRPIEIASTDSVEVENHLGVQMVMEHLRSHGYKRIVCVATDFHLRSIKLRVAAYDEYLRRARLPRKKLVLKNEADVLPALRTLFSSSERPDALFTTNNICTTTVIQSLHTLNIRIQRDVALVGFDDVEFYSLLKPSITAISQPVAELGRTATRLLFDRIRERGPSSHVRLVLPVALVVRESCGCKK
jgi:LacI family transcriptional regulator